MKHSWITGKSTHRIFYSSYGGQGSSSSLAAETSLSAWSKQKSPMKDRGSFIGLFYWRGLLPYRFPKKGENWIALGNQNELRVESLEKEFGRSSSLYIGYQMDRTDGVIAEIFLKIFSKNGERGPRDRSGGGGAAFSTALVSHLHILLPVLFDDGFPACEVCQEFEMRFRLFGKGEEGHLYFVCEGTV